MKVDSKFGQTIGFLFLLCVVLVASDTAVAAGGSWGSWGASRGSVGGSWGSRGGAIRTPVRNLLGRVGDRVAYRTSVFRSRFGGSSGFGSWGSNGGFVSTSYGSYGSSRGSFGSSYGSTGSWGSSYASSSSAAGYGSWGSSYVSTIDSSYGVPVNSGFAIPMTDTGFGYMDSGIHSNIPMDTTSSGVLLDGTMIEGATPANAGFYEGGGIPIEGGGIIYEGNDAPRSIIDEGGIINPGVTPPNEGFDPGGIETPPVPSPSEDSTQDTRALPITDEWIAGKDAILSLKLPREAKVYINDRLTHTEGNLRSYVSRRLKQGQVNEYHVKAVLQRSGKEIVRTQTIKLKPGLKKTVALDFDKPAVTTLALKVPADAKVRLCESETNAIGRTRYYATRTLADGEVWKDYRIAVSVVRDGKTITREKTIDLQSGDTRLVSFDFATDLMVKN